MFHDGKFARMSHDLSARSPAGTASPLIGDPEYTGRLVSGGSPDTRELVSTVERLTEQVNSLETQQLNFIQADIQHLRELAVLNRAADALGQRRNFAQVMLETASEALAIMQGTSAWIIEPDASGKIRAIQTAHGPLTDPSKLPLEARDLYDRVVQEKPNDPLILPHYDPEACDKLFVAQKVATGKHLMGVAIIYAPPETVTDSHHIRLLQSLLQQAAIACENARLFETLSGMIVDVVIAMALAIESRDPYTGGHVMRVTAYSLLLANAAGLSDTDKSILRLGGLLHDIGKVAVPDAILRKPDKLNDAEFEIMKAHASVGHQIISEIPQLMWVGSVVRSHHERWDGAGYPDGLSGERIPLVARVAAIADMFDAMTSDRPYRKGMAFDVAQKEIARCAGTQFDGNLTRYFVDLAPETFALANLHMRKWRESGNRLGTLGIIDMLDLNLPRISS